MVSRRKDAERRLWTRSGISSEACRRWGRVVIRAAYADGNNSDPYAEGRDSNGWPKREVTCYVDTVRKRMKKAGRCTHPMRTKQPLTGKGY